MVIRCGDFAGAGDPATGSRPTGRAPPPGERQPAVVDAQPGLDVLRVGPDGVQRNHELRAMSGPFRSDRGRSTRSSRPQRLDQARLNRGLLTVSLTVPRTRRAQARAARGLGGGAQQGDHRRALVQEHSGVALRLGRVPAPVQGRERCRSVPSRLAGQRLQRQDLDVAALRVLVGSQVLSPTTAPATVETTSAHSRRAGGPVGSRGQRRCRPRLGAHVGEPGVVREHLDHSLLDSQAAAQSFSVHDLVPQQQAHGYAALTRSGGAARAVQVGLVVLRGS